MHRVITGKFTNFLTDKPYAYGQIKIRLSANDYTLLEGIPAYDKIIGLDKTGNLPSGLKLFCNADGLIAGTFYEVTEPDGTKWNFRLPYGDGSPISLQTLRAGGVAPSDPQTVIALIENKINDSAVRYNGVQTLSAAQKEQGRLNINGVGREDFLLNGLPVFPMIPVNLIKYNCVVGQNDIYTVPAGKKLIVSTSFATPSGGVAQNFSKYVKIGTVYSRLTAPSAGNANFIVGGDLAVQILNAGETFSINTDRAGGICGAKGFLVDASVPIKNVRLFGLTAGNNTLYSVPAGKKAMLLNALTGPPSFSDLGGVTVVNFSGASVSIVFYQTTAAFPIPSGETLIRNAPIGNGAALLTTTAPTMNAGDSIILNTGSPISTDFLASILVYEF